MKNITILYMLITLLLSAACDNSYHDEDEFEELEEHEEEHEF